MTSNYNKYSLFETIKHSNDIEVIALNNTINIAQNKASIVSNQANINFKKRILITNGIKIDVQDSTLGILGDTLKITTSINIIYKTSDPLRFQPLSNSYCTYTYTYVNSTTYYSYFRFNMAGLFRFSSVAVKTTANNVAESPWSIQVYKRRSTASVPGIYPNDFYMEYETKSFQGVDGADLILSNVNIIVIINKITGNSTRWDYEKIVDNGITTYFAGIPSVFCIIPLTRGN